ncbi:gluconokinase [Bradyrhizobium sp. 2TAF24]|uniref:gluconokinase n=1 Tax=Bradyrhizobium sp. 2TAF24 TaxID=3233011 RepID=UPI003F9094FB
MTTSSPDTLAAIILMGVSGSGKSTVASALAQRTGLTCADADSFHPQANITKMHAGIPLTDEDRWPWLRAIAAAIDHHAAADGPLIIACSALKRAYRDLLVHGRRDVRIVYLRGSQALIAGRLAARRDHFMPSSLLDSQFATLEEPTSDEPAITVGIDASVETVVDDIIRRLDLTESAPS